MAEVVAPWLVEDVRTRLQLQVLALNCNVDVDVIAARIYHPKKSSNLRVTTIHANDFCSMLFCCRCCAALVLLQEASVGGRLCRHVHASATTISHLPVDVVHCRPCGKSLIALTYGFCMIGSFLKFVCSLVCPGGTAV